MSLSSISSTYPEPASSPSPRTSPTPIGFVHTPLRRTYAFYIPRRISTPPVRPILSITTIHQVRRSIARRSRVVKLARTPTIWNEGGIEQDEKAQNEPEETMAPPAKRRKIKH
ncbi:hypothetical protein FRC02_007470 [Tulasnella sp. 418]|nr:hypothetical protein FRC02_007470 [Tulasnella sp. 418]